METNMEATEDNVLPAFVQADDLGRIFEVGFNTGILTAIAQERLSFPEPLRSHYQQELERFKFGQIVSRLATKYDLVSSEYQLLLRQWATDVFRRGWLAGSNFFRDYLEATGWRKQQCITIRYFQASFRSDNSFGLYPDDNEHQTWLTFFGDTIVAQALPLASLYERMGEFLKADTLMLLQYAPSERRCFHRILAVDESIFSIRSMSDLKDINRIEAIRSILQTEVSQLRSKSVFARLGIDTGHEDFNFPESLGRYFSAFKRSDKESAKMIQAGSYAYSFYQFLTTTGMLSPEDRQVLFNVVGYSDQGMSTLSVTPQNLSVLETCHHIYSNQEKAIDLANGRKKVLDVIRRNVAKSFGEQGTDFVKRIVDTAEESLTHAVQAASGASSIVECTHDETLSSFTSTASVLSSEDLHSLALDDLQTPISLRDAHATLVKRALRDPSKTLLFLTGNPGIGKTTAVAEYLLNECAGEGFLFFYVSPRKQVNLDIIKKFQFQDGESQGQLRHDDLITLHTSSALIEEHGQRSTVEYRANRISGEHSWHGVTFVEAEGDDHHSPHKRRERFHRATDDVLRIKEGATSGVLRSLCNGIYAVLDLERTRCIVATASIQSLKKIEGRRAEDDTLVHFRTIFKNIYNEKDRRINVANLEKLRRRMRHIIFMIDEVTGDESGVEFLARIQELLEEYGLLNPEHGFNTKIIVADASLVGAEIIQQHLKIRQVEPDKIFFMRTKVDKPDTLSIREHHYLNQSDAFIINANSFPAGRLHIHYHITVGCAAVRTMRSESDEPPPHIKGERQQQEHLAQQVVSLLRFSERDQIIVYIQNKRRLSNLIERIRKRLARVLELPEDAEVFERNKHYLEIHADIAPEEQKYIQENRDQVRVIFMTASASRGLSFPYVRHLLVDVPRFDIAKNLMEIIQVVYRGRGNDTYDQQQKEITFYLSEYIYPSSVDARRAVQECILNLFTILLLLKLSLLTRIQGYGQMGTDQVTIIPLGGKAVSTAFDTFGESMADLLQALVKEKERRKGDPLLEYVHQSLRNLLRDSEIKLKHVFLSKEGEGRLSAEILRKLSNNDFFKRIEHGLYPLEQFRLEPVHVDGGLLIVPLANTTVQETYQFRLAHEIATYANKELLKRMRAILAQRSTYTDRLRMAIKTADELITKIEDERVDKSQSVLQTSRSTDRYYAFPLLLFASSETFKSYFAQFHHQTQISAEELLGDDSFRNLLGSYIRMLYPVTDVLPIAGNYESFPYIVFRSYSLKEARRKMFTDRYLLASSEFNILNMLLAKE